VAYLFFVHPLKKNNRNKLSSIFILSGCSKISGFALFSAHFKWQRATVKLAVYCTFFYYIIKYLPDNNAVPLMQYDAELPGLSSTVVFCVRILLIWL